MPSAYLQWRFHSGERVVDRGPLVLFLELSPLHVFEFDFLSLLCNTNTLRNILMMLGTGRDDVLLQA